MGHCLYAIVNEIIGAIIRHRRGIHEAQCKRDDVQTMGKQKTICCGKKNNAYNTFHTCNMHQLSKHLFSVQWTGDKSVQNCSMQNIDVEEALSYSYVPMGVHSNNVESRQLTELKDTTRTKLIAWRPVLPASSDREEGVETTRAMMSRVSYMHGSDSRC